MSLKNFTLFWLWRLGVAWHELFLRCEVGYLLFSFVLRLVYLKILCGKVMSCRGIIYV